MSQAKQGVVTGPSCASSSFLGAAIASCSHPFLSHRLLLPLPLPQSFPPTSPPNSGVPIAVRHLESVIRLAEACAKAHLRDHVHDGDIDVAIKVSVIWREREHRGKQNGYGGMVFLWSFAIHHPF